MIPILLLICVSCVGVLGVVAMGLGLKQQYVRSRDARARITARNVAERAAREQPRPALKPTPIRTPATVPQPVGDLTGVIATLEQSVRFATVPARDVQMPAAPRRSAKGSVAPPLPVRTAVAAAPLQRPVAPQMYPVVHVAKPPAIPAMPRTLPPPPPTRRR